MSDINESPKRRRPHPISLSVCSLVMQRIDGDEIIPAQSFATGFLWRHLDRILVFTNWHNLTGINPETNKMLGSFRPTHVRIGAKVFLNDDYIATQSRTIPLYANGQALWIEHPERSKVDCVAIDIMPWFADVKFVQVLNECNLEWSLTPSVGMDAFIVGFPEGLDGPVYTPIWKRASVASEPIEGGTPEPIFLVDTASRPGMSGSPVIIRQSPFFAPEGGIGISADGIAGFVENLCGIYSGRIGDDGLGVQLGRVWKIRNQKAILESGVAGIHPDD